MSLSEKSHSHYLTALHEAAHAVIAKMPVRREAGRFVLAAACEVIR